LYRAPTTRSLKRAGDQKVQARDGRRRKQLLRHEVSPELPRFPWPNLSGIHAFVIDDNEDTRRMLTETLEHCGAVVTAYESADACIADLGEVMPTVFVCDLSMPNLNGLQFMRRIRQLPPERGGQVPSIAVTAYYEDFAAAHALEAGFDAYLMKPVRLEQLCRLIRELTERSVAS